MKVKKYNCIKISTKAKTKEEVMKNGRNQKTNRGTNRKTKRDDTKKLQQRRNEQQKDKLDQLLKEYTNDLK